MRTVAALALCLVALAGCGQDESKPTSENPFPGVYVRGDRSINPDEQIDGRDRWVKTRKGDLIEVYDWDGTWPLPSGAEPVLVYEQPLTARQLAGDDPDCKDFSDAEAKESVENGDPNDLDRDGDGVPCE